MTHEELINFLRNRLLIDLSMSGRSVEIRLMLDVSDEFDANHDWQEIDSDMFTLNMDGSFE